MAHFAKGADDMAMADKEIILGRDPGRAAADMIRGLMFAKLRQCGRMVSDMSDCTGSGMKTLRPTTTGDRPTLNRMHWTKRSQTFPRPSG